MTLNLAPFGRSTLRHKAAQAPQLHVRRLRSLMSLRLPSLALGSVLILARRLGIFGVATVNRKFWPIFTSGLGAFPANPSNPAINPTSLTAVGLFPRYAS